MSTFFRTTSGSEYEIRSTPWDYEEIRRIPASPEAVKCADGEWIRLISCTALTEGYSATLTLASLAPYGPDDEGREDGDVTYRTTSAVTRVWHA